MDVADEIVEGLVELLARGPAVARQKLAGAFARAREAHVFYLPLSSGPALPALAQRPPSNSASNRPTSPPLCNAIASPLPSTTPDRSGRGRWL